MDLDAIVGDVLEEPRTITKVRSRNVSNSLLANYALRNACHPSLLNQPVHPRLADLEGWRIARISPRACCAPRIPLRASPI